MSVAAGIEQPAGGTRAREWRLLGLSRTQVTVVGLGLIVLLGAVLRFYKLGAYSIGNSYYAATVKSMLTSWHNFFFAAYEPGGSVTVDKPPLGFWLQAASAYVLGVNGFALALPQALAGTLSIPLLYGLVRRQFGRWAGLIAALALAVTPVAVSAERNNTIDGLLVFVLLLATWAFWRATRSGRLHHVLLGAVLVGLGFNVKMLQAFLPLPAFYLLYLLGARVRWGKRLVYLGLATVALLAVALSWAIAVDLTPPEDRPYIGSSTNNTVMELIVGHNGLKRLNVLQFFRADDAGAQPAARPAGQQAPPLPPGGGQNPPGNRPVPPGGGPGTNAPGGDGRNTEVGEPGWLRLLTEPLVGEAGWLLPVALLGIPLVLLMLGRPWPLSSKHLALALWAAWLLPEVVYFTFNSALWHAYYLIMLGPPLAALVGATAWALWRLVRRRRWLGLAALALIAAATLLVQFNALGNRLGYVAFVLAVAAPLLLGGLALLGGAMPQKRMVLARPGLSLAILSLLVAPLLWSGLTALNENPNVALPRSGPDTGQQNQMPGGVAAAQDAILDYLLAHTDPETYLVAGLSSHDVSGYILATGRPALTFGGFNGGDDVVTVERLAAMVESGELRYVLGGQELSRSKPEIGRWVQRTCTAVKVPGLLASGPGQPAVLYDCGDG
jgi:4-amino-4-deoxy-L-arabinose transferase-like glycosyltransferase